MQQLAQVKGRTLLYQNGKRGKTYHELNNQLYFLLCSLSRLLYLMMIYIARLLYVYSHRDATSILQALASTVQKVSYHLSSGFNISAEVRQTL